ncbi:putative N-acetyltransferase ycf52 [Morella rubra]|uniref:Putative N-acetyltransferase ycf52 n=1 Tax=Morella rubra TaxID=262757 RepID=A0A6A1VX77_9ROSI|nr:putative N-acetyltransferase ycf52 [Morella rubra]
MDIVAGGSLQQIQQGYPSKYMELRWVTTRRKSGIEKERRALLKKPLKPPALVPVYISRTPSHISPDKLKDLYRASNHSCHRLPNSDDSEGTIRVEPVDIHKLTIALSHSSIVVSVFCKPTDVLLVTESSSSSYSASSLEASKKRTEILGLRDWFQKVVPVTPFNGQLVGFGRAVSDFGLTASIYDIMVIPSLRKMGIGRLIVGRIVRMLASRDIHDISAVCSENERLFFRACGFGDDILGSTTMMYSRKFRPFTKAIK